ncbi:MAG: sodium/solute symporter [Phycisphaerae bacterium]|jgi:SSS family solute:Na+ symporter
MTFTPLDYVIFFGFIAAVIAIGTLKSRGESSGEDFFLAGRGLKWWLIGFSLIAANISTEQFVGMSGNAASHIGLAIASYEWMAAITLVVVAFGFLPFFLKAGIYTMPEFLEQRYNQWARLAMSAATLLIYCLLLGAVTYSGALTIKTLAGKMGINIGLFPGSLAIGLIAMFYVATGGLKACAWADLLQGSALIIGGGIIMYFAFDKLGAAEKLAQVVDATSGKVNEVTFSASQGAMERFWALNKTRMNMILPATDSTLPWTALCLGLWIPNFYYWGLNQYITQRTLGAASLSEGQKGIVFSAFMKLLIPFVIVVPGIMAFNLYAGDMQAEAVDGNVKVIAEYYKSNSATEAIVLNESATTDDAAAWQMGDKIMLAVCADADAVKAITGVGNPYVYPIIAEDFAAIEASDSKFVCKDKTVLSVYPTLTAELESYNATQIGAEKNFLAYKYDTALAQLLGQVLPQGTGLIGFVLAALLGAVVSSLAALLNAASTIFSLDIYKKYMNPNVTQHGILALGRGSVLVFTLIAVVLSPALGSPKFGSIFTVIQEGQGILSPGVLAVFVFGLISKRAPKFSGVVGLLLNAVVYIGLMNFAPGINFLNRMAICLAVCVVAMIVMTIVKPLPEPYVIKANTTIELSENKGAKMAGIAVILITLVLYFLFSPLGLIK